MTYDSVDDVIKEWRCDRGYLATIKKQRKQFRISKKVNNNNVDEDVKTRDKM